MLEVKNGGYSVMAYAKLPLFVETLRGGNRVKAIDYSLRLNLLCGDKFKGGLFGG